MTGRHAVAFETSDVMRQAIEFRVARVKVLEDKKAKQQLDEAKKAKKELPKVKILLDAAKSERVKLYFNRKLFFISLFFICFTRTNFFFFIFFLRLWRLLGNI